MRTAILLSGGMDSIAITYWKKPKVAITIDYGHRAAPGEVRAARAVAESLAIEHYVITTDLSALGSGDLSQRGALAIAPVREWWPFRNQMLVTLAATLSVGISVEKILIGCLSTDGTHADGRREFVERLDGLLRMQEGGLRLEAPAVEMTAVELIRTSKVPFDVLAWAHSCHTHEYACGTCRGCRKHYETMAELGHAPF
jgi:7-cyano-7-deazaguanine synthase